MNRMNCVTQASEQERATQEMAESADVAQRLATADPSEGGVLQPELDHSLARITKIYDGDTCTILFSMQGQLRRCSVRIKGVDCPEIRGRGPAEKAAALAVRDVVREAFLDRICTVTAEGLDKYGRLIGSVRSDTGLDLASYLLENQLARSYAGESRDPFSEEELRAIMRRVESLRFALPA
jgi:endonuclease YncB( thermonuclease family)